MKSLKKAGVVVIGSSPDSLESHKKFMDKHDLNFTLITDPDKKIAEKYGAYGEKNMYGKKSMGIIRSTFLIGIDGKVEKAWTNVKAKGHIDKVMEEANS